jgi:hypothetical protein
MIEAGDVGIVKKFSGWKIDFNHSLIGLLHKFAPVVFGMTATGNGPASVFTGTSVPWQNKFPTTVTFSGTH